jgi:hypothetical protein
MCFVLYVGTSTPLPDTEWRDDAPDLTIKSLTDRESPITGHFRKSHVQCVGSTSQCGCDFPHVIFQSGGWPWYEGDKEDEFDHQSKDTEKDNRERLVRLLRQIKEPSVELYGVWDGDFDFNTPPLIREEISVDAILGSGFRFKERGFYTVRLADLQG